MQRIMNRPIRTVCNQESGYYVDVFYWFVLGVLFIDNNVCTCRIKSSILINCSLSNTIPPPYNIWHWWSIHDILPPCSPKWPEDVLSQIGPRRGTTMLPGYMCTFVIFLKDSMKIRIHLEYTRYSLFSRLP